MVPYMPPFPKSRSFSLSQTPTPRATASPYDTSQSPTMAPRRRPARTGRPLCSPSATNPPKTASAISNEVISISSSPTGSTSWGSPPPPLLMPSHPKHLSSSESAGRFIVRAELKTPWFAWNPNRETTAIGTRTSPPEANIFTHDATPGLDLDWESVVGSQRSEIKKDVLAEMLRGVVDSSPVPEPKSQPVPTPSTAPNPLKRKASEEGDTRMSSKRKTSREGIDSVPPRRQPAYAIEESVFLERQKSQEPAEVSLNKIAPEGAGDQVPPERDRAQEQESGTIAVDETFETAGENAVADELTSPPKEKTAEAEDESAMLDKRCGHSDSAAHSDSADHSDSAGHNGPSPEEIWKGAVADRSLPGVLQGITNALVRTLKSKEEAITDIAKEYRENAIRLIEDMSSRHALDGPTASKALNDACHKTIAALGAAEKEMADLVHALEGPDFNRTEISVQHPSLAEKMAIYVRLCEKKLARYTEINADEYWERMQDFPEGGIVVDSLADRRLDHSSVQGVFSDESTSVESSFDGFAGDEGFGDEESDGETAGDQRLVRKYWRRLQQNNKGLQGPRRAAREMQTEVILLLGGRSAKWRKNQTPGSAKSKPKNKHDLIDRMFDNMISKLEKELKA